MNGGKFMAIKFGELKKYLSRVVKLSICFEDGHYDNYLKVSDIPEGKYDDLFVFGIGMADVEFPLDVYSEPTEDWAMQLKDGFTLGCALEVVVHKEPRDIERKNPNELTFGDIRYYLQCGRYFSIVKKEDWSEEDYEWREEISNEYDDMYVYGIGIEDNPRELSKMIQRGIIDTQLAKKMRIVVSESPRA